MSPTPKLSVPKVWNVRLSKTDPYWVKVKFKNRGHNQADHCPTDTSRLQVGCLPSLHGLLSRSVSTGDMAASRVPHPLGGQWDQHGAEKRDPSKQALLKCQDNNFPSAAERQPLGSKAENTEMKIQEQGCLQAERRGHLVEKRIKGCFLISVTEWAASSESFFRNKDGRFFSSWFLRKIKDQKV